MENMYIICLTSGSGIPVFTRTVGNIKQLPFPVIGSLNAVHMFAANHDAQLRSTSTEDFNIDWKEFHNSLVLIAVSKRDGEDDHTHTEQLLDLVWHAMVLLYGLDDLINIRNVERFKREIKVCYQLIDTLILQSNLPVFSDVTGAVEGMLTSDVPLLQSYLDAFVEAAASPYGCLLVHGRLVVATPKWWELTGTELVLVSLLIFSFPACSSRDVPIYLPHGSPTVPHRLLTFQLMRHVEVCVICGPTPSLVQLEKDIGRFWAPSTENLKSVRQTYPRNFPPSLDIDKNILGLLLVNTATHHSVSSVDLCRKTQDQAIKGERCRALLRSFYKMAVGSYFSDLSQPPEDNVSRFSHEPMDTYIVCRGHKCYAHSSGQHQLFVLFSPKMPNHAMRSVSQKTLQLFLKDKALHI